MLCLPRSCKSYAIRQGDNAMRLQELPNNALAADRKKPRPLKSAVHGGFAAVNRGADYVQPLAQAPCA